jgi:hypothetical protein
MSGSELPPDASIHLTDRGSPEGADTVTQRFVPPGVPVRSHAAAMVAKRAQFHSDQVKYNEDPRRTTGTPSPGWKWRAGVPARSISSGDNQPVRGPA